MTAAPDFVRPLWLRDSGWDRRGGVRLSAEQWEAALADPDLRVCEVTATDVRTAGAGLAWRPLTAADRAGGALLAWLGGTPGRVARLLPAGEHEGDWAGWREVVASLAATDAHAAATGLALARWHGLHGHCPRCGAPTEAQPSGWVRRCPEDGSEHYPRTDPVVIMAVVDGDDRICLARGHQWVSKVGMSCPAGFVDAAESIEDAVRREVAEELGLRVVEVSYAGSQPWPAAGQLMVAAVARVADPELHVDPAELAAARWFDRDEFRAALAAGEVTVPISVAAGRWLIERWLGEPISDEHATIYSRTPAS